VAGLLSEVVSAADNGGMPDDFTALGIAHRRYGDLPFGIRLADRLMHMYVIGQTGTGKSTLIGNLVMEDAAAGLGFCLIEPHGDLAQALAARLSPSTLFWDVADPASPYGYNPLARVSAAVRPLLVSGIIDTLKKQWSDAWGARMEHLLRYALLALLEQPQADLRDVIRLFLDKDMRRQVVARVSDPQVRQFWTLEYPKMNFKTAIDGVAPIANKLGAFLAHPVVRKALCEPPRPLRFRRLMDEGGMLIVSLAKGKLGNDTANVLGGLLVSSLMHAAFSRHDMLPETRRPFMLYVDEFHSFSTSAFASMLSETRKYGLGLTLAHQHLLQTEPAVLAAIFGNVGSLFVFRVGAPDAAVLMRQLDDIPPRDLTTLRNHRAYVQLMVEGMKSRTFSASIYPPSF
jgi:type IV secretory pathway TraG/TraD family ATPase VirD4